MTLQRYTKANIIIGVWQTLFARQIDQFFSEKGGRGEFVDLDVGDFSPDDLDFFSKS